MRVELNKVGVCFEPTAHTYTLDGKELQGVTGMIDRQIFGGKFEKMRNDPYMCKILEAAQTRGSNIHNTIELYDDLGCESDLPELKAYIDMCKENNLVHEYTEYMVSDLEHFASKIDKVYRVSDDEFILADIKTGQFNAESVSWQLSIYAHWFRQQNPTAKITKLLCIHLRPEEHALIEVSEKSTEEVERLLRVEIEGGSYLAPTTIPEQYLAMQDAFVEVIRIEEEAKAKKAQLFAEIEKAMRSAGVTKWEMDKITFTIKKDSQRTTFDSKSFKEACPELYSQYLKSSVTRGGFLATVK